MVGGRAGNLNMMNIVFRTDATSEIGTGHFMRCLTLADTLKKQGSQVCFVSRNLPTHLSDMLEIRGMGLLPLTNKALNKNSGDLAHSHWLGLKQEDDAQATIHALSDQEYDWLVVDHYALDICWETALRANVKKIMVIDDIADRVHDCDILLDQNYYTDMRFRYEGKVPKNCQLLLGPRYALLRDEFIKIRNQIKPHTGKVKKLLVFFGGVDADNYTELTIEALSKLSLKEVQVDVVIGMQHPQKKRIVELCSAHGYICHVQTTRMAELMSEADLAIGAGGTAAWERCSLGLPAITISVASNQSNQVIDAAEAGLLYGPLLYSSFGDLIQNHTRSLLENPCLIKHISSKSMQAVDGKGVNRVSRKLRATGVKIREVESRDSEKIFLWRNHPFIRLVSRNTNTILWENHQAWFADVLADSGKHMLIGQIENKPIGVVRFDEDDDGDTAEVSIYLVPEKSFEG
ncbi:MAG: UDP-2,4-diacetamido-2,4,6-trideoxy-beta-L-altropyranose hydrolase [Oleiphilaceae bacterium]|jgi:UDP-2,4-diacetamido-2,4,6-trideoxy-beta-L-altropyranose hydrolase